MIRYFARHPTAANLMMMAFLLFGLLALPQIKRETFPDFSLPYLSASISYPGASPRQIEETVCTRFEEAIDGLSGIEKTTCQAVEGNGTLLITLSPNQDMSRLFLDIQSRINGVTGLPKDIDPPVLQEAAWTEPVVEIAIAANTDWFGLKSYADKLKRILSYEYGVSLVEVRGFSTREVRVTLDGDLLRQLGVSLSDIATQVEAQNINVPIGNIELKDKTLLVRFDEEQTNVDAIGKIVVKAKSDGGLVRLQDIATLEERFSSEEEQRWFNGQPSAVLEISKNKSEDALRIKALVEEFVEAQQAIAPDGITLTMTNDFSSLLLDRLNMMIESGIQGAILVFLVMWLFFSWRYSFWVAAGLPVAFMGSFFLMAQLGLSINIMSLVALLMAIGIMMDDAIVISESIATKIDEGLPLEDAVVQGVKQVLPGVLSSYLTTVCIFGSLIFLEGEMGAVLRVVPMVLILVLTISLFEAFLILPHHLLTSLQNQKQSKPSPVLKRRILSAFESFREVQLEKALRWALKWRYACFAGVFSLLLISLSLLSSGILKFVSFPDLDGDVAEARISMSPGTPLAETQQVVSLIVEAGKRASARLSADNEAGQPLVEKITEQYNVNSSVNETGPHLATVRLDLLSAQVRKTVMDVFLDEWKSEAGRLAKPVSVTFQQPSMGPGGRDFELLLHHEDLDELKQASIKIQQFLSQIEGVSNVIDDMRPGKEEINITLKKGAEAKGINGSMIASQLRAAYVGETVDEVHKGREKIEINLRLASSESDELQRLLSFPIRLSNGHVQPLSSIANIGFQRDFVRIQRLNGSRTLRIFADVAHSKVNLGEVFNQLYQDVIPELQRQYPGLALDLGGQAEDSTKTGRSMAIGFLMGLFGIFVILSYQFRSYLEPLIVMVAIPLSLIGVLWGHLLLGHSLSMPSLMGFVSLAGVVVNDSILLVQFIRKHYEKGESIADAALLASKARFRAVFLTSLTTAVGLLPLLLETSLQAQVVKPLVISIVFGIFTSTLLVLFMIPITYAILADLKKVKRHQELHGDLVA